MGHKQYGKRAGGSTSGADGEIYSRACGQKPRRKKAGHVSWTGPHTPSAYEQPSILKINDTLKDTDKVFQAACSLVGVAPSKRQYSKWRNGRGAARAAHAAISPAA